VVKTDTSIDQDTFKKRGISPEGWLADGSFLVRDRGATERFIVRRGQIRRATPTRLPNPVWSAEWSPDGRFVAFEPIARRGNGYTASLQIMAQTRAGKGRRLVAEGSLAGWSPQGHLLYWRGADRQSLQSPELVSLDLDTGAAKSILDANLVAEFANRAGPVGLGDPIYSADGRFIALQASVRWKGGDKNLFSLLIARADGEPIRFITSRYAISMFTWSPTGHRLAYTTSGFPSPHQLFVVPRLTAEPKKLFSRADHFDWVTWSPDGKRLLLDAESISRWLIFDAGSGAITERVARLGGAPTWCCPAAHFTQSL
jgi:Tol biopolymer transport system component